MDKSNAASPYNEIYSTITRNEALTHTTTWLNLKYVMLSERSQVPKVTYYVTPLI